VLYTHMIAILRDEVKVCASSCSIFQVLSRARRRDEEEGDKLLQVGCLICNILPDLYEVAKTADLILIMLDATKSVEQRRLLEAELDAVGIRLNKSKPDGWYTFSSCSY